jgi:hypothetical protein
MLTYLKQAEWGPSEVAMDGMMETTVTVMQGIFTGYLVGGVKI